MLPSLRVEGAFHVGQQSERCVESQAQVLLPPALMATEDTIDQGAGSERGDGTGSGRWPGPVSFALQALGEAGAPSSTPQEGGQRLSPLQFPTYPPGGSVCSHQCVNGSPVIFRDAFLYLYVQGLQDTVNVVDEVLQLLYGSITWK